MSIMAGVIRSAKRGVGAHLLGHVPPDVEDITCLARDAGGISGGGPRSSCSAVRSWTCECSCSARFSFRSSPGTSTGSLRRPVECGRTPPRRACAASSLRLVARSGPPSRSPSPRPLPRCRLLRSTTKHWKKTPSHPESHGGAPHRVRWYAAAHEPSGGGRPWSRPGRRPGPRLYRPARTLELGLKLGEFTRGLLVLGAPPRLTILHLDRMPLHVSLEGDRRPQLPH